MLIEAPRYGGETFNCCAACNLKFWDLRKVLIVVMHDFVVATLWKLKRFGHVLPGEMPSSSPSIAAVDGLCHCDDTACKLKGIGT